LQVPATPEAGELVENSAFYDWQQVRR
jgi:hypothetical protein